MSGHPSDEQVEARARNLVSSDDMAAALAERDRRREAGEDPALAQVLVEGDHLTLRQANELLRDGEERILLCPTCKVAWLVDWRQLEGEIRCVRCMLGLDAMRRELLLPDDLGLLLGREYGPSLVGRIEGSVQIKRRLPEGRLEGWYLGEHRARKEGVVLFELPPPEEGVRPGLDDIRPRIELVRDVQHPGRPVIFELAEVAGRTLLMQSYLEGISLDELIARQGPLRPLDMLRIATTIAEVMKLAHTRGLLGFDLFPQMVVLESGTEPRLLDVATGFLRRDLAGQRQYRAPELLEPGAPLYGNVASDVYTLGALCHAMLFAEPPQRGDAPIRIEHPDVSQELATLLERSLSPDPGERPEALDEVLAGLEAARAHQRWLAEQGLTRDEAVAAAAPEPPPPEPEPELPPPYPPSDSGMIEIASLKRRVKDHLDHRRFQMAARALSRIIAFENQGDGYAREVAAARTLLAKIEKRA